LSQIKHFCGIAGLRATAGLTNVPEKLFYVLFSLQHRGQESCGIAYERDGRLITYKDVGMVSEVLARYLTRHHASRVGIGHVRYSTQGTNKIENAQPITIESNKGTFSLVHNGNISNSAALRRELFEAGSIFQGSSDTELILHLIARSREATFQEALVEVLGQLEGAFNLLLIHEGNLYVLRDPNGFRPLVVGRVDDVYVVASETCALDILQVRDRREVEPGEMLVISDNGVHALRFAGPRPRSACIFELIYFARPDSTVFDQSVHLARERMGAALARNDPFRTDMVIPVPDSGTSAALGYAKAAGIPLEFGFVRNHYAGRTFIQPTTSARELGVRMKLHPIREVVEGRRITIVDDSLVRGTTSKIIVKLLREAGATEVHLRLSAPELRNPCYFGIDIPTRSELISNHMSPDQIAAEIGANSVRFLGLAELLACFPDTPGFCHACFSGRYPVAVQTKEAAHAAAKL
jgi:amidophosphoribosyltransferase